MVEQRVRVVNSELLEEVDLEEEVVGEMAAVEV